MFLPDKSPGEVALPSRENLLDDAAMLLLAGAAYIEQHGWCGNEGPTNGFCASNALVYANAKERDETFREASRRLWSSLGGYGHCSIWAWNDAPGRTQAEVVAKLRSVALGG